MGSGDLRSYFRKVANATELTIPKLNEMASEQVELAGVPFISFIANKGRAATRRTIRLSCAVMCVTGSAPSGRNTIAFGWAIFSASRAPPRRLPSTDNAGSCARAPNFPTLHRQLQANWPEFLPGFVRRRGMSRATQVILGVFGARAHRQDTAGAAAGRVLPRRCAARRGLYDQPDRRGAGRFPASMR